MKKSDIKEDMTLYMLDRNAMVWENNIKEMQVTSTKDGLMLVEVGGV